MRALRARPAAPQQGVRGTDRHRGPALPRCPLSRRLLHLQEVRLVVLVAREAEPDGGVRRPLSTLGSLEPLSHRTARYTDALEVLRAGSVLAAWHGPDCRPGSSAPSCLCTGTLGPLGCFTSALEGVLRSRGELTGNGRILVLWYCQGLESSWFSTS